jgi:hypothetical protein
LFFKGIRNLLRCDFRDHVLGLEEPSQPRAMRLLGVVEQRLSGRGEAIRLASRVPRLNASPVAGRTRSKNFTGGWVTRPPSWRRRSCRRWARAHDFRPRRGQFELAAFAAPPSRSSPPTSSTCPRKTAVLLLSVRFEQPHIPGSSKPLSYIRRELSSRASLGTSNRPTRWNSFTLDLAKRPGSCRRPNVVSW